MGDMFINILLGIAGGGLVLLFIGYMLLNKSFNKDDIKYARELKKNLQTNTFSKDVIYQKLYNRRNRFHRTYSCLTLLCFVH